MIVDIKKVCLVNTQSSNWKNVTKTSLSRWPSTNSRIEDYNLRPFHHKVYSCTTLWYRPQEPFIIKSHALYIPSAPVDYRYVFPYMRKLGEGGVCMIKSNPINQYSTYICLFHNFHVLIPKCYCNTVELSDGAAGKFVSLTRVCERVVIL